jgi:hypothetical protein
MNSTRYSYVRNNPLKYTDPSGYITSGGYWLNNPQFTSGFNNIHSDRLTWNNYLDDHYNRGSYGLNLSPFEAFYAYYGISSSIGAGPLDVFSQEMQFNMAMGFVVNHTGIPFSKKGKKWGLWVDSWRNAGIEHFFEGYNTLPTLEKITTFVPFSYNPENYKISLGKEEINSILSLYDNNIEFYRNLSLGINIETMMISGAAAYNTQKLILTIGKLATKSSAGTGIVFNAMDAWSAYNKGHYYEGTWQTIQAIGYAYGFYLLYTPAFKLGIAIIAVNGIADIVEYFIVN